MAQFSKFNSFLLRQFNGNAIDFAGGTVKLALVTSTFTPNAATQTFFSDVTNEVSGTGYTAGGYTLAGKSVAESAGTVTFDADDVEVAQDAGGFTNARRGVLYFDTGVAGTSPLIAFSADAGSDRGNVNGPLSLRFDATGIFTVA